VLSCNKGLNEPRRANLKGIMAAKTKPYAETPAQLPEAAMTVTSLALPPARAAGKILGTVGDLVAALRNEAKVL
jgi:electron transfer flavoprotein beta subunit